MTVGGFVDTEFYACLPIARLITPQVVAGGSPSPVLLCVGPCPGPGGSFDRAWRRPGPRGGPGGRGSSSGCRTSC
jgi:hypothetical protein